jgi:hypothetical protein
MSKFLGTSGSRKHIKLENSYYSKDTPEVQIAKVLQEQQNMKGGEDLRKWSQSARKALKGGRSAAFLVSQGKRLRAESLQFNDFCTGNEHDAKLWSYEAPKLAMVLASPVIRDYFVQNPDSTEFPVLSVHFKSKAIESIAHWLRIVIIVPELHNIRLPKLGSSMSDVDLKDCLNIRVAMEILGMEKYIDDFASNYQATLLYPGVPGANATLRIPSTKEARRIIDNAILPTQDGRDEVVDVLADHLVILNKKNMLDAEWIAFLGDLKNIMLGQAVKLAEARFSEKVKKERKERDKARKFDNTKNEGVTRKDRKTPSAISKNKKGTQDAKSALPKRKTNNLFDLLAGDDE